MSKSFQPKNPYKEFDAPCIAKDEDHIFLVRSKFSEVLNYHHRGEDRKKNNLDRKKKINEDV